MTVRLAQGRLGSFLYQDNDQFIGRALEVYGEASEGELELLRQLVVPAGVVIEAGANIGTIAIPLARALGPQGRLILFEPQRLIFQMLCGNLALNEISNTEALHKAVGAMGGVTTIQSVGYGQRFNYGSAQVGVADGEAVEMVTIDSLELSRLDLLIADVEGYEEALLIGAERTLMRCRPSLYLENNIREKSPALLARLFACGYQVWWHLPPMFYAGNGRGVTKDVFNGMLTVNILCLPEGRASSVKGMRPVTSVNDWWRAD